MSFVWEQDNGTSNESNSQTIILSDQPVHIRLFCRERKKLCYWSTFRLCLFIIHKHAKIQEFFLALILLKIYIYDWKYGFLTDRHTFILHIYNVCMSVCLSKTILLIIVKIWEIIRYVPGKVLANLY
jgi:hypothetical protein